MNPIRIGIVGATGYVGAEVVRILSGHPYVKMTVLSSRSYKGKKYSDVYPFYRGICDQEIVEADADYLSENCDYVIAALPHGVSAKLVPELLSKGLTVIDHSGDFRFRDKEPYEKAYKLEHPFPELLKEAVYGLPEIYREKLKSAKLAANPGCYPTCSILGLAPLLKNKLIQKNSIIIDAVSGYSGAGRKSDLDYSLCEAVESFKAYGVSNHRHTPEIEQELSSLAGEDICITFTPHLAPMKRGMLATIYSDLNDDNKRLSASDLLHIYKEYYKDEFFVRVLDENQSPETRYTSGSNFLDIGVFKDSRTGKIKILSAQDNLGKGAAAQAVQTLNVMAGFPETTALFSLNQGL